MKQLEQWPFISHSVERVYLKSKTGFRSLISSENVSPRWPPYFQVKVIELYRPPDGYFGFQISPAVAENKLRVFISGFGHGLTDKLFTGLMAVSNEYSCELKVQCSFDVDRNNLTFIYQIGDEVLNVNGHSVSNRSFTEVISLLSMSQTLLLTVKSNEKPIRPSAGQKKR